MKLKLKKWVTYLLVAMMAVPVSLWMTFASATPAKAADKSFTTEARFGSDFDNISSGSGNFDWINPQNAGANDDIWSKSSLTNAGHDTDFLRAMGFGFSIPTNATVTGISLDVKKHATCVDPDGCSADAVDDTVKLVKDGDEKGSNMANKTTAWSGTDSIATYYDSAKPLWGTTWTPLEINADNFGVVISAKRAGGSKVDVFIDYLSLKVSYTIPDTTTPTVPVLLNPADGTYVNANTISSPLNLSWEASTDPDDANLNYDVKVDGIEVANNISVTNFDLDLSAYSEGDHRWEVRASDGVNTSDYSDEWTFVIDTNAPTKPLDLAATVNGPKVNLSWDEPLIENGSGIAGYEIYRAASPAVKINSSLVTDTTYTDTPGNGTFTYYVVAIDNAGNVSDPSNGEDVRVDYLIAPVVTATQGDGKSINVAFTGVGGGVTGFDVVINGVVAKSVAVTGDDTGLNYLINVPVGAYGDYSVVVIVRDGTGANIASKTIVVSIKAPAEVAAPPVVTAVATETTIVSNVSGSGTSGSVSSSISSEDQTGLDEQGKIKAAEETSGEEDGKINWTPWIILFILILLAGAATGGYFYWFGGEEGAAATVAIKEKAILTPVSKKKNGDKKPAAKPTKKSRRW